MRAITILAAVMLTACATAGPQNANTHAGAGPGPGQLDFLAGDWIIQDADGEPIGTSRIVLQVPDTMLYEERVVDGKTPQPLWLENAERNNGWTQLFVGPAGQTREFPLRSEPGTWPIVMGADVVLRNGTPVTFRLTLSRQSDDESRRVLEMSADQGDTWKTILEYQYRRASPSPR